MAVEVPRTSPAQYPDIDTLYQAPYASALGLDRYRHLWVDN